MVIHWNVPFWGDSYLLYGELVRWFRPQEWLNRKQSIKTQKPMPFYKLTFEEKKNETGLKAAIKQDIWCDKTIGIEWLNSSWDCHTKAVGKMQTLWNCPTRTSIMLTNMLGWSNFGSNAEYDLQSVDSLSGRLVVSSVPGPHMFSSFIVDDSPSSPPSSPPYDGVEEHKPSSSSSPPLQSGRPSHTDWLSIHWPLSHSNSFGWHSGFFFVVSIMNECIWIQCVKTPIQREEKRVRQICWFLCSKEKQFIKFWNKNCVCVNTKLHIDWYEYLRSKG